MLGSSFYSRISMLASMHFTIAEAKQLVERLKHAAAHGDLKAAAFLGTFESFAAALANGYPPTNRSDIARIGRQRSG